MDSLALVEQQIEDGEVFLGPTMEDARRGRIFVGELDHPRPWCEASVAGPVEDA